MKNQLISVIVPVYNVEKYLSRCLDSIIFQTHRELEIILVDDGSTDNSSMICDEYAKKDCRITVIHTENHGLSEARNKGIENSHGEYISFVDSDDYLHERFLETLLNIILETGSDLSVCDFIRVDENGNGTLFYDSPIKNEVLTSDEMLEKIINSKQGYKYIVAWNKLYSKRALSGVRFPAGKIHEDEATIHHVICNCHKIVTTNSNLYFYVVRNGSITNKEISIKNLDYIEALADRINFLILNKKTCYVDKIFLQLVTFYCDKRKLFKKVDKKRIDELDTVFRKTKRKSKPYLFTFRSKVAASTPFLYRRFVKILKGLKQKNIPFFTLFFIRFFRKQKKKKAFRKSPHFQELLKAGNKIIFLDVPTHGNVGDQAICESEKCLLEEFYNTKLIQFTYDECKLNKRLIKKYVNKKDKLFLPGGGFVGTLWPNEHNVVVDIIKNFPNNKIVMFPQTVFFGHNIKMQKRFAKVCNKCCDLTIMVRDQNSMNEINNLKIDSRVVFAPDVVLAMGFDNYQTQKNGKILLCLRHDKEKAIDFSFVESKLFNYNFSFDNTSTVLDRTIFPDQRKEIIQNLIRNFSEYSLVITDRLHAMLFSLLGRTPCIAFDNSSKKVSGVAYWIKEIDGIICIPLNNLSEKIIECYLNKKIDYSSEPFRKWFYDVLKEID